MNEVSCLRHRDLLLKNRHLANCTIGTNKVYLYVESVWGMYHFQYTPLPLHSLVVIIMFTSVVEYNGHRGKTSHVSVYMASSLSPCILQSIRHHIRSEAFHLSGIPFLTREEVFRDKIIFASVRGIWNARYVRWRSNYSPSHIISGNHSNCPITD